VLKASASYPTFRTQASPEYEEWLESEIIPGGKGFHFYNENQHECPEGFVSLISYLTYHAEEHARSAFWGIAKEFSKQLNPLALKQAHLRSWPLFGRLRELEDRESLFWDIDGKSLRGLDWKPHYDYEVEIETEEDFASRRARELKKYGEKTGEHDDGGISFAGDSSMNAEYEPSRKSVIKPQPVPFISSLSGMVESAVSQTGSLDLLHRLGEFFLPPDTLRFLKQQQKDLDQVDEENGGDKPLSPSPDQDCCQCRAVAPKVETSISSGGSSHHPSEPTSERSVSRATRKQYVLSRNYRPVVVDVGTFDGSDWAQSIVNHGYIGIGFEMVARNRNLLLQDWPFGLSDEELARRKQLRDEGREERDATMDLGRSVEARPGSKMEGPMLVPVQKPEEVGEGEEQKIWRTPEGSPTKLLRELNRNKEALSCAADERECDFENESTPTTNDNKCCLCPHSLEDLDRQKELTAAKLEALEESSNGAGTWKLSSKGKQEFHGGNSVNNTGFFHFIGAALGEKAKTAQVLSRYDYSSVALHGYLNGPPDMESVTCPVIAFDDLFEEIGVPGTSYLPKDLKIDLVKIDAEGYELGVLRGMEKSLAQSRIRFLTFEYQPAMLGTSGSDPEGLLWFIAHYGFHCYSLKLPAGGMPTGLGSMSFREFSDQYLRADRLKLRGMGGIEDIICENRYWKQN